MCQPEINGVLESWAGGQVVHVPAEGMLAAA
jgi:hypothetical protein